MRDLFAKTFLDIIRANNALMQCRERSAFNAFSQKVAAGPRAGPAGLRASPLSIYIRVRLEKTARGSRQDII